MGRFGGHAGRVTLSAGSSAAAGRGPPGGRYGGRTGCRMDVELKAGAKMTTEFFIEIAKLKPGIAFFRDDAFVDDFARTNLQQVFNHFSPTTSIKVI